MTRFKLTPEQTEEVKTKYLTHQYTCLEIANQYNVSYNCIYGTLKRNGVTEFNKKERHTKRKYNFNERFFDVIDTEEKAYYLGLIASDGTIDKKLQNLGIELQSEDGYILERFYKEINTYPERQTHKRKKRDTKPNNKDMVSISVCSRHMISKIVESGIPNNKSLILEFPTIKQIPTELLKYYLKGIIDGDGSIKIRLEGNHAYTSFYITTTKMFADKFSDIVFKNFNIKTSQRQSKGHAITSEVGIYGSINAIKFLEWIYKDSKIHLTRKYNKYILAREKMLSIGKITEEDLIFPEIIVRD